MNKRQVRNAACSVVLLPGILAAFLIWGHDSITHEAVRRFAGSSRLTAEDERLLVKGASDPDVTESGLFSRRWPYDKRYHFDDAQGYAQVCSNYLFLQDRIEALLLRDGDDPLQFGRLLHALKDFYSHSNYVELYRKYQEDRGEMHEPAPPIEEVWGQRDKYAGFVTLLASRLRTGSYPDHRPPEATDHGSPFRPNSPGLNKDSLARPFNDQAKRTASQATYWYLGLYLRDSLKIAQWQQVKEGCVVEPTPLPAELATVARQKVRDGTLSEQVTAIGILATDSSAESRDLLVEVLLQNRNPIVRSAAAQALKHRPEGEVTVALKNAARDPSRTVREFALVALASSGSRAAFEAVADLTERRYPIPVRASATQALAAIPSRAATDLLNTLLHDQEPKVRALALESLTWRRSIRQDVLSVMFHDSDPSVIAAAVRASGELRIRSLGPLLAKLLHTSASEEVRRVAATALGDIRDLKFTPDLTTAALAQSERVSVRVAAISSLALIGNVHAAGSLIALMNDAHPAIRVASANACVELRSHDASGVLRRRLQQETGNTRSLLAGIAALWPDEFKETLEETLSRPGAVRDRLVALESLNTLLSHQKLGIDQDLRRLLRQSDDLALRYAAAQFLKQRPTKENVAIVIRFASATGYQELIYGGQPRSDSVPIPDVTPMPYDRARAEIEDAGLTIGEIREMRHTTEARTVFIQEPAPFSALPLGASLTLYVSLGASPPGGVRVPDLLGKSADDARAVLRGSDLYGMTAHQAACGSGSIVVYQLPAPGTLAGTNERVYLFLGDRKEVKVPALVGQSPANVAGSHSEFYVLFSQETGGPVIYKQDPPPNSLRPCGSKIEVWY